MQVCRRFSTRNIHLYIIMRPNEKLRIQNIYLVWGSPYTRVRWNSGLFITPPPWEGGGGGGESSNIGPRGLNNEVQLNF